jgi:membrane protein implicated in regulation of membrane protease activity
MERGGKLRQWLQRASNYEPEGFLANLVLFVGSLGLLMWLEPRLATVVFGAFFFAVDSLSVHRNTVGWTVLAVFIMWRVLRPLAELADDVQTLKGQVAHLQREVAELRGRAHV